MWICVDGGFVDLVCGLWVTVPSVLTVQVQGEV
jgi:hypothetical protein